MPRIANTAFLLLGSFLLVIVVPLVYDPFSTKPFLWSKLIVVQSGTIFLLCSVLLSAKQVWRKPLFLHLDLAAGLFCLVSVLSLPLAINSFKSLLEAAKILSFLGLYFAVSRSISRTHLRAIVYGFAIVTGLVSVVGIAQYLRLGFMWIPSGGYPSATFLFRNSAAMYLVGVLPLVIIPFVQAKGFVPSLAWGMVASLPTLFVIYTRTRGAWVGLMGAAILVGSLVAYLVRKRNLPLLQGVSSGFDWKNILAGACCVAMTLSAAQISPINKELQYKSSIADTALSVISQEEARGSNRVVVWEQTLDMIRDHWVMGVGLGNWELLYPSYTKGERIRPGWVHLRPHNDLLWIASELGLIGLGVFLWLLLKALRTLRDLVTREKEGFCGLLLIAIAASLLAISGHSLFSFPKERIPPSLLFWGQLGVIAALVSLKQNEKPQHSDRSNTATLLTVAAAFGVLAAMLPVSRAFFSDRARYDMLVNTEKKNWVGVKASAERSIRWGVQDYRVFLQKAQACLELEDVEAALEANVECLSVHPNSVAAYQNIGKLSGKLGRIEESLSAFDRALELDPDNGWLFHDRGIIHASAGAAENAFRDYSKAIQLGSDSAFLRFNRAGLYRKHGVLDSALVDYQATIVQDSTFFRAHVALGELYQAGGHWEEAEGAFRKAVGLNSDTAEPFYNLGYLYLLRGDREHAIGSFQRFLELWRGDPQTAVEITRRLEVLREGR